MIRKMINYISLVAIVFQFGSFSCGQSFIPPTKDAYARLGGETMGTYYAITYADLEKRSFQQDIDSILQVLNAEVSTYIPTSVISLFNQSGKGMEIADSRTHFLANLKAAKIIVEETDGYFDPTVMPLVNYWGFGYTPKKQVKAVDSLFIDSLMQYVGFDKLDFDFSKSAFIGKTSAGVQLDFSAIAKGYGVDLIGEWLEKQGIRHYLVDIGGEMRAKGKNSSGIWWTIGVNRPVEGAELMDLKAKVPLKNRALATSGNYRNYYEVNGKKYSHTIHPKAGFPERNNLLSASIFAKKCISADAYATACMAMGFEKAKELIGSVPAIEGYLIFGKEDGSMGVWHSKGLEGQIEELD